MIIKKENLVSHIDIFNAISNLKDTYKHDRYEIVIFDKNIDFINPFFLILLLQHQKQTRKFLILDMLDCTERLEGYIFTFLTQQIQFDIIKFPNTIIDYQAANEIRYEKYIETYSTTRSEEPTIYLYATEKIKEKNIKQQFAYNFCSDEYTFLPILSLTNETKDTIEYSKSRIEDKISQDCREFYKSISVDYFSEKNYEKNLKLAISQVIKGVKKPSYEDTTQITKKDFHQRIQELNNDLSSIFFELIDNIKRHTKNKENKKYANAFLSSRYNNHDDQYEYAISDDYTKGFIESFKVTLEANKETIPPLIFSNIEQSYKDIEKKIDLKSIESDEAILNGIFGVKDTIGLREIQRVTMHFGIPMLLKLLQNVQGKLDIYVHHEEHYYHIFYNGLSNTPPTVESLKDNEEKMIKGVKGTHIYLTLPRRGLLNYLEKKSSENIKQSLNIKNQTFKNIFNTIPDLKQEIDSFHYLSIEDLENELFKQNDIKQLIIKFSLDKDNEQFFNGTISDFIRALLAYAFFHNVVDIYIYNFPIDKYKQYLLIIVKNLYDTTELNINIPNIIFQNSNSFDVTFIGGETYDELLSINKSIAIEYNSNKESIYGSDVQDVEEKIHKESKLFFQLGSENIILPFVLIQNRYLNENILGSIIVNSLEAKSLNIHVDTKKGYHLNKFYQFKNLFSDSQWVNRIAFVLAQKGDKYTYYLGTDKYTSLTIAVANSFLGHNEYLVVDNIRNIHDQQGIKSFIEKIQYEKPMVPCKRISIPDYSKVIFDKKSHAANNIIVFSSVSFSYENISKYVLKHLKYRNYKTVAVIDINLEKKKTKYPLFPISTLKLKKNKDYFDVEKDTCKICTCYTESKPLEEKPLYELDEVNTFSLKNFYKLPYELISKKSSVKIDSVLWHDSIHFVHAQRGHNHYTFYTKTINFFQQNKEQIKFCLEHKIKKSITKLVNSRKVIIFAPRHSTNNNFITYVDEYLFDNNATVYRFDKENGEQNFYDMDFVDDEISDPSKTAVFFVDDEISSGYTMEYFYTLLRVKGKNRRFDASIVMIDRTTINDTKALCNYIEGRNFKHKIHRLYSFTKLEIKPIKTEVENCFLCEKQKDYEEKLINCTLDMNRFQIAERIVKLNQTDAHLIDSYSSKLNLVAQLKTYLKMYAVDYVYRNFDTFHQMAINHFNKHNDKYNVASLHDAYIDEEKKLFDEVNTYLKKNFLYCYDYNDFAEEIFERICRYEINIALLKAISFPKLAYYEDIRKIATKILICRIRLKIRANKESYQKIKDCSLLQPFIKDKAKKLTLFSTIFNEGEYDHLIKNIENSDLKEFFTNYKDKNNLNYINFLYITAAYLDISYILAKENILFYYQVSNYAKEKKYPHDILHIYPTAVKLLTSKYVDKARYFDQQLVEFYCMDMEGNARTKWHPNFKHGTKRYSLINALLLENTVNKNFKPSIDDAMNLNDQFLNIATEIEGYCKKRFKEYIGQEQQAKCDNPKALTQDSEEFKIEKIYINEHMDRSYNDYIEYLEESRLLDLLSEMKELENNNIIYPLYLGAVSDKDNKDTGLKYILDGITDKKTKELELKDNIDCTWSNMHIGSYKLDENIKQCTIVRLVEIDYTKLEKLSNEDDIKENKNLWFKPVGLVVASHDGDYSTHLVYSRILLSLQNYLINFFKKKFDYGKFQEAIERKNIENYLSRFNHLISPMLNIRGVFESRVKNHFDKMNKFNDKTKLRDFKRLYLGINTFFEYSYAPANIARVGQFKSFNKNENYKVDVFAVLNKDKKKILDSLKALSELFSETSKVNKCKYDIHLQYDQPLVISGIENHDFRAILFEFCYNASKYNNLESHDTCIIKFIYENGIFLIDNNRVKDSSSSGSQIGLDSIGKVFDQLDYEMSIDDSMENKFRIEIKEKNGTKNFHKS